MNDSSSTNPFMLGVERIMAIYPEMTDEEREAFAQWEREHLDGASVGTTVWPGWRAPVERLSH